jgi:hypothetical protein
VFYVFQHYCTLLIFEIVKVYLTLSSIFTINICWIFTYMMKVGENVIQVFNDSITIELECILMFYKDHNVTIVYVKSFVSIITLEF